MSHSDPSYRFEALDFSCLSQRRKKAEKQDGELVRDLIHLHTPYRQRIKPKDLSLLASLPKMLGRGVELFTDIGLKMPIEDSDRVLSSQTTPLS